MLFIVAECEFPGRVKSCYWRRCSFGIFLVYLLCVRDVKWCRLWYFDEHSLLKRPNCLIDSELKRASEDSVSKPATMLLTISSSHSNYNYNHSNYRQKTKNMWRIKICMPIKCSCAHLLLLLEIVYIISLLEVARVYASSRATISGGCRFRRWY